MAGRMTIEQRLDKALTGIAIQGNVLLEEKTERDFRCLTNFNLDANNMAYPYHHGGGGCDQEYGTPAEPWHASEILEALQGFIKKMATKFARNSAPRLAGGDGPIDPNAIDDAMATGALAIVQALRRGRDKGERGVQPTTWLSQVLRSAIHGGLSMGMGAEQEKTRGRLKELVNARSPSDAKAVLDQIPAEADESRPETLQLSSGNQFGQFAPRLREIATNMLQAMQSGDRKQIQQAKQEAESWREELFDQENTKIQGTATARLGGFGLPHSGDETERFKKMHKKTTGYTVKTKSGKEIEHPEMAPRQGSYSQHTSRLAAKETINQILELGLQGVETAEAGLVRLNTNEFRALIRLFGISDYPTKGTPQDPELNSETGELSDWAQEGYPQRSPGEIARDLNFAASRSSQLIGMAQGSYERVDPETGEVTASDKDRTYFTGSAYAKLRKIAREVSPEQMEESRGNHLLINALSNLYELGTSYLGNMILSEATSDVDVNVVRDTMYGVKLAYLEAIFDHSYPPMMV